MRKLESAISVNYETFMDIVKYENEQISGATVYHSNLGSPLFFHCILQQLRLDHCDLNNARFFAACTIEQCQFIHCDLRAVGIGDGEAVFTKCEFIGCDMRGMTLEHATFIDCTFNKCTFSDRILKASRIVNCCFVGKLSEITFEGTGKQKLKADFANCRLNGVQFIGCDLTACIPPNYPDHLYVNDLSARIANALMTTDANIALSADERKQLVRSLNNLQRNEQYIFNMTYMNKMYGATFTKAWVGSLGLAE
ncbi:pentapeptide repeat-containing protein [Paenibacillus sp. SGZ-1009]|uniref:pentapeptide repeat-containing protein n=1 Tax=Paenibacillus campi TaxID=3106031 RepID=UPI002AFF3B06|nr:pentapeptide repeat-containing protein [Paenibacillus sp. SGZ-1009]